MWISSSGNRNTYYCPASSYSPADGSGSIDRPHRTLQHHFLVGAGKPQVKSEDSSASSEHHQIFFRQPPSTLAASMIAIVHRNKPSRKGIRPMNTSAAQQQQPQNPDTAFVQFWNTVLAPKFIRFKHVLVDGLTHHSEAVFPSLPVQEGDRVLDVGCGFGDTAIKLAKRVGPTGKVVGIDCCDAFLDYARKDADTHGLDNISFERGDAEIALPVNEYDFVFARFGTMFFARPGAALRNMRKALRPGGRMVHIVWRDRADNPWLSLGKEVVLRFLPEPGEDALTCGPGPFSMSNEGTVRAMMESAGYTDIEFRRVDAPVLVGSDVDDAVAFQLSIGPAGEVFREAGAEAEAKRDQIEAALAEAINGQKTEAAGIVMDSSSWVISATNPGQ
jgi:ubiquinone/menaquinone biosynthesis C-methylase UbiE